MAVWSLSIVATSVVHLVGIIVGIVSSSVGTLLIVVVIILVSVMMELCRVSGRPTPVALRRVGGGWWGDVWFHRVMV